MDTSETFKRMSLQAWQVAPELFGKNSYDSHDYTFTVEGNDLLRWLPRQDQLQDMLPHDDAISLLQRFWGWIITRNYVSVGLPQPSMEQLWLCFVMWARFEKVWNGGEWVKEPVAEKVM